MLSEFVEFRGFEGERFTNLLRLICSEDPDGAWVGPPGLIVLRDGERLLKSFHTRRGVVGLDGLLGESLEELARRYGARWVTVVEADALQAIHEGAAAALRVGHDLLDFLLAVAEEAMKQKQAGQVEVWPDLLEDIRLPSREALERVFDVVLPPKSSAIFYVFDGSKLFAELLCVRGSSRVTHLAGHDALEAGPPPARWREDYRCILAAATSSFEPPSIGVFVSRQALQDLLRGDGAGALADVIARGDLILDPLPLWLAGPMGVTAMREVVDVGRKAAAHVVERYRPTGFGARLAGRMTGRVVGKMRSALEKRARDYTAVKRAGASVEGLRKRTELSEILGFDPFALIGKLAALSRASVGSRDPADAPSE